MASDSDSLLVEETVAARGGFVRYGKIVAMGSAALGCVVAAAATSSMVTVRAILPAGSQRDVTGLDAMLALKPAYENCAQVKEDCLASQCCAPAGYYCFKNSAGRGKCMRECTPGGANGTCEGVSPPRMEPVREYPGGSLFCWSVYTANTGGPKPSTELDLLQESFRRGASLFACADWAVYSDVVADIGEGHMTTQVVDVKQDFHLMKRKTAKTWINTGMFVQVWKAIREEGKYRNHNWVIKVDADAVFFPQKLVNILADVPVSDNGVYLENCKFVDWGYFGNLEVFSKEAFARMTQEENLERCYSEIPWKVGVHGGKYGPMGEDLFAQKCMDLLGVGKQEMFQLTTDGACESDRPEGEKKNKKFVPDCAGVSTPSIHPFKKVDSWVKCWEQAKDV